VQGRILSGCSVNAALTARALGLRRVALLGCAGGGFVDRLRLELNSYGLSEVYVKETSEMCGFKLTYSSDLRSRTLKALSGFMKLRPSDVPLELLDAKAILIGPVLREVDLELVEFVRRNSKAELFLDPQGLIRDVSADGSVIHVEEEEVKEVMKLCDYVKPNEAEAEVITGLEAEEAVKELWRLGAKVSIVTLADRGSLIYDGASLYRVPAYRVRAVDPTGAGDVYAGAFIYARLKGLSLLEAGLLASAAASIKVEHVGPSFVRALGESVRRVEGLRMG
jgi:sugar/nucleoside kinase (ribokinase family)